MAKLRDWWPAEERSGSSSSSGGGGAAAPIRLSDVTAALNSLPPSPPPPPPISRPIVRLGNSDNHKQELIRALLGRSSTASNGGAATSAASSPPPPRLSLSDDDPELELRSGDSGSKRIDREIDRLKSHDSTDNGKKRMKRIESCDSISLALRLPDPSPTPRAPPPLRLVNRPAAAITSPKSTSPALAAPNSAASDSAMDPLLARKESSSLSRREIHIFSERQRRKGMTHLYATLHSLLPDAKPKTDRCTVLTEAMEYIQGLQAKVEELGKQKAEMLTALGGSLRLETGGGGRIGEAAAGEEEEGGGKEGAAAAAEVSEEVRQQIMAAADVVVRFSGRDAFITLNSPKRSGVWSSILHILHSLHLELLNVTLSTSNQLDYHCIHAKMGVASDLRSRDLQRTLQELVLNHAVCE